VTRTPPSDRKHTHSHISRAAMSAYDELLQLKSQFSPTARRRFSLSCEVKFCNVTQTVN
jgi:hypothetical protein